MGSNGENGDHEKLIDHETGLPFMSEDDQEENHGKMVKMLPVLMLVPRIICGGIAFLIYYLDSEKYDNRMRTINFNGTLELGYAYIAFAFLNFCGSFINMFPMLYKAWVMDGKAGNLRANMMIYKMLGEKTMPYVVLEDEGEVGIYNRANRGLNHFVENTVSLVLCFAASLAIFSLPAMVLVIIFGAFRVLYSARYAEAGYGAHGGPYAGAMLASSTIEMLTWGAGIRMFQLA